MLPHWAEFHKLLLTVNWGTIEDTEHRRYMILLKFQKISLTALLNIVWKREQAEDGRPVIWASAHGDLDQGGSSGDGEKW